MGLWVAVFCSQAGGLPALTLTLQEVGAEEKAFPGQDLGGGVLGLHLEASLSELLLCSAWAGRLRNSQCRTQICFSCKK